jgi:hypothetical protein
VRTLFFLHCLLEIAFTLIYQSNLTLILPLPPCSMTQNKNEDISADRQEMERFINNVAADPIILSLKYLEICTNSFTSKMLGEGAFGKVYLGYDNELKIFFAVKRIMLHIPNQDALDEITLSFKREIAVSPNQPFLVLL